MLELDGSVGEGGGQILRSALALSMCTGTPVHIERIRAKRRVPGLMRQHLTAVQAAVTISHAEVSGMQLGSQSLQFRPGKITGGQYRFAIGTAGSCTLVLQTVLPALIHAGVEATLSLEGGTHNPMAPPYHFLERAFVPLMRRMGADMDLKLKRFGFYPAGGGCIEAHIRPSKLQSLKLLERGERRAAYAECFIAGIPGRVAERELSTFRETFDWPDEDLRVRGLPAEQGPGNVLVATLEYEALSESFSAFGEKGVTAEAVAGRLVKQMKSYLGSKGAVGEHLADQLLLPLALAGGGSFTATYWSDHARTNAEVIEKFIPVSVQARNESDRVVVEVLA